MGDHAGGQLTVTVVGTKRVTVGVGPSGEASTVERSVGFECTSGAWIEGDWRGIPVEHVLDGIDPPGGTTHLLVASEDGCVACPSLSDALDGLLAVERDGRTLSPDASPRFVAPGIPGPRALKGVRRLETLALEPQEDPTEREVLPKRA